MDSFFYKYLAFMFHIIKKCVQHKITTVNLLPNRNLLESIIIIAHCVRFTNLHFQCTNGEYEPII